MLQSCICLNSPVFDKIGHLLESLGNWAVMVPYLLIPFSLLSANPQLTICLASSKPWADALAVPLAEMSRSHSSTLSYQQQLEI